MKAIKRVFVVVLDSAGVGFLPDAADYGDLGANTFGHIGEAAGLNLPNMAALGLGNIIPIRGVEPVKNSRGAWGKAAERSRGKDTTIGHWEIAGLVMSKPLPTWPEGIPADILRAFEEKIGRKTLGGTVASGTEILKDFGDEHVKTGCPIVYTSADSVFQIAAHEEVVPLATLYDWCHAAREMLDVGRIIARPFVGKHGAWQRTPNRHDYSLDPPGRTILDRLSAKGIPVVGVGKISDIFAGRGIGESHPIKSNRNGMEKTIELAKNEGSGFVFVNLVDFDMKYGHRRDVLGYKAALEEFDAMLPELTALLRKDELLIITADHGCDPIFHGTDHTREHIPLLACGPAVKSVNLGTRKSFADIAATIGELLLDENDEGSFAGEIL
jgi:phosphopentomutase